MDLKSIWEMQLCFTKNFIDPNKATKEEKIRYTKEMLLHLVAEVDEILNAIGDWKPHRLKKNLPLNKYAVAEEIVDAFKFLLNIAIVWGITPEFFYRVYTDKSWVVTERYEYERQAKQLRRCAVIDIDGVLTDYPDAMLQFLRRRGYNFNSLHEAKKELGGEYTLLKHEYREIEGEIPPKDGAKEFLQALQECGYSIVLMTSRPIEKYPQLELKTINWLKKHELPFSFLHFTDDKIRDIKMLKDVKFVVEDDAVIALQLAEEGYKVYWLNQRGMLLDGVDGLIEVKNLREVLEHEFGTRN
jgi:uncharacterized HAD superfamily protein/NTP pyrophosphatase (non-canonical NTP hydrolase)